MELLRHGFTWQERLYERDAERHDRGPLTVEGYTVPTGEVLSVTGGVNSFSGASGFVEEGRIGTNVTGCPNFRAKFHIQLGLLRGASD